MDKRYQEYIDNVIAKINADSNTKERIRQSLGEHIDVLIEKHGSLAYRELDPAEKVAEDFSENLGLNNPEKIDRYKDNYPWWLNRRYKRRVSSRKILGLPLYHITDGYIPETGKFEVAKGIFAFGPVAVGLVSFGAVSAGILSFGAISLGMIFALGGIAIGLLGAVGGAAIGGLLACGGLAVSYGLAFGGGAIGYIAIGDKVSGEYIYNTTTGEGNAVEWFRDHLPYFVKFFN